MPFLFKSHCVPIIATPPPPPSVLEVVPSSGPAAGGTRIAILGANFINSPQLRVKFGDVVVCITCFRSNITVVHNSFSITRFNANSTKVAHFYALHLHTSIMRLVPVWLWKCVFQTTVKNTASRVLDSFILKH